MFHRNQRARVAIICLTSLVLTPLWAREGGGLRGGGGVRREGGAPVHAGGGPGPAPHAVGAGTNHGGVGIHGGHPELHERGVGANHVGHIEHGGPGGHYAGLHQPGPHWNGYHQAYIGNHNVHLAWAGYRPSYYYHPWYHGPWGGHAWGWGWGFGPGLTFGIGGGGFGVGISSGWGYPSYYGPYGAYGYWGRPLGWGFGGWGLGTTVYSSGYYSYYNPYYYPSAYPAVVYDYSRPISVAIQAPPGAPSTIYDGTSSPNSIPPATSPPLDNPAFDMARDSFKRGDYVTALRDVDAAIKRSPTDAVMHEFRSLTLFALRDYRQSAAVAHSILAVGPGWDYTTMSSLYPDPFVYSEQLRHLEEYAHEHPRAADAHFLLAYHEMIGSRKDEALTELRQVVKLMPTDRLAAELLTMVKGPPKQAPSPANPTPYGSPGAAPGAPPFDTDAVPSPSATDAPEIPPVDKTLLPGTWNAAREDGSKFRLTLTDDGTFTWKYSPPNQKGEEFAGTYTVDGPVLVLERKEGGALAGTAQFSGDSKMNFKLVGGPPEDKGLNFGRFQ